MKKFVDGHYLDMTQEEIAAMEAEVKRTELAERYRPFTAGEVSEMLITAQINTLAVDDHTALRMQTFYPTFESAVGQTVKQGFKFTYGGKLWRVNQPELLLQGHYLPGDGTQSLYSRVCEAHTGTMEDPVPYQGNMALEKGKYYFQDGSVYLCVRDTGNPVHHALEDLAGLYAERIF